MQVYLNNQRISFLESQGVEVVKEQKPVFGFGETGPVGFGIETVIYRLKFLRKFPKGFDLLSESLENYMDFTIVLKEEAEEVEYQNCNWIERTLEGDEWEQVEKWVAKSYVKVEKYGET